MLRLLAVCALGFFLTTSTLAVEQTEVCRYCGQHHQLRLDDAESDAASRKYAPDRLVDVLRIAIDVTPDFKQRTVAGVTTLTFAPISEPVEELRLSATRLRFSSVTGSVAVDEYVATDEDVTILFKNPIPVGQQASVTLTYTCEPKEGLYFRTEAMGYPAGDDHLWSQGEAHEAPSWFPCFDYPNERSATEVTCRVPPEMTVLSNGYMVSERVDPATGLKAVHWRQDKPHVNYLVCLAAGYFKELKKSHGELDLGFYTQPSLIEHAANAFADTDSIIAFYEQETGVKFPWDKYYQVTVRDCHFGGMENTSLTVLTHGTVFSNETENIRSSRDLDAHETAHQWFGDLVTCEDWSQLWLNEGFATYYTHLYNEHKLGRDELLYGLYQDASGSVLTDTEDTRPIVWREYDSAMDQFDFRAYPKGSWVLHMLRSELGVELYRKAINSYLNKHKFTSVVTPDLVAEFEDATGKSLDRFFDQWVYHGGFPVLKITHKWLPKEKLAHVHVEQTQETGDEVLLFHLPTKLRFQVGDKAVDHEIVIDDREHDFYVPLSEKPTTVRFDPEYAVLAKVDFDKPQEMLEAQLKNHGDLVGRLLAVAALAEKEEKKAVEALKGALHSDPFYGVRVDAATALGKQQSDEALEALLASSAQPDARVRAAVVRAVAKYYKPAARDFLIRVADSEKNPAIVGWAIEGLGKFGEPEAVRRVAAALGARSLHMEAPVAAVRAAGALRDPELSDHVFTMVRDQRDVFDGRDYDDMMPVVAKLWAEADDRTQVMNLLLSRLEDRSFRVRTAAAEALGILGDRRAELVLTDLSQAANKRTARTAKSALEQLNRETGIAPKEVSELRKLVRDLQKEQKKLQETVNELTSKAEAESD